MDSISRIEVYYHRKTMIKPEVKPENVTWKYVTWNYHEKLTIDRDSETITYEREIGSGCKITNTYYVEGGISLLLDDMNMDLFSETKVNPPKSVKNPLETKEYSISLVTKCGNTRTIHGTFDKEGLPADWTEFIGDIFQFIQFYGDGEIFDEYVLENDGD